MRVGFLFVVTAYGPKPSIDHMLSALSDISTLGFEAVELEGVDHDHLAMVYSCRARLRQRCRELGLTVENFVPMLYHIPSLDKKARAEVRQDFERGVELAAYFGCQTIEVDTFTPVIELQVNDVASNTYQIQVPSKYSWNDQWALFVDTIGHFSEVAGKAGLKLTIHPRVHEVVANTSGFLRLHDELGGGVWAVFDLVHSAVQKEILEISLHKLRDKIAYLHLADTDGMTPYHYPIGVGKIDWDALFNTLKRIGYNGGYVIDVGLPKDKPQLMKAYRSSRDYLMSLLRRGGESFRKNKAGEKIGTSR